MSPFRPRSDSQDQPVRRGGPLASELEATELQALLVGRADGGKSSSQDDRWRPCDFRTRHRELSASELARFRAASSSLSTAIAARLGAYVGRRLTVELLSVGVVDFSELSRGQPRHASLHVVEETSTGESHVIALPPRALLAMVQGLLGESDALDARPGAASVAEEPPHERNVAQSCRRLTRLEEEIGATIVAEILLAESEAWALDETPSLRSSIEDPRLLESPRPDDPVALALFSLRVGERAPIEGDLFVALPPGRLLHRLCGRPPCESAPAAGGALLSALEGRELDLELWLESEPLPLERLLSLRKGDVIDTGVGISTPLELRLNGERVALAHAGSADRGERRERGRAARIVD